jgi:hypothetical protein
MEWAGVCLRSQRLRGSFAYHARAGLVIALALAGNLGEALRELHVYEDKLVAAQRDDERAARLMGLAAIDHMLARTERARELLATLYSSRFFGAVGILYLLTQLVGTSPAPDADVEHQALIDIELATLDALDL